METLFVGRQMRFLREVDSTNKRLFQRLQEEKLSEGAALWTLNQTQGKGQPGNTWNSADGAGLAISYYLKPTFLSASEGHLLTEAVALAVCDTLNARLRERVQIKWPNDILVGKRKLCGILIESQLRGNTLGDVVIGIGVNLHKAATTGVNHATSIEEQGAEVEVGDLIERLSENIEARYFQLKTNRTALESDFHDRLFGRDDFQLYDVKGEMHELRVLGVTSSGQVEMEDKKGRNFRFSLKEISYSYL